MSARGEEVLKEALSLPEDERERIADLLLSSLDDPERRRVDEFWAKEAEERLAAFERGEIDAIPAEEVFAEIEAMKK